MKKVVNLLQQWSIPLIAGVFVALAFANVAPHAYHVIVHEPIPSWPQALSAEHHDVAPVEAAEAHIQTPGETVAEHADDAAATAGAHEADHTGLSHYLTLHFLINDIFMVFFFGIATKEIVESCLPGGALNPPSKAINPLLGTIGGVLGPIGVFLGLNAVIGTSEWARGWGIPTATDIALAWLVARIVFGAGHPAISFLLLLAVADDAIGLGIIAFGYPDPNHPTVWSNALWIVPGMAIALGLRMMKVQAWPAYILVGGAFSWWGLYSAHLHPALALVPIVPFLPAAKKDVGLFKEEADYDHAESTGHHHSPLEQFEHQLKLPVDLGLFLFAFANAGVGFSTVNSLTWIVFLALLVGKVAGITGFSWVGSKLGFPLPGGMQLRHLFVASMVAGIGLTVALFVAGQAFQVNLDNQSAAKMGALFSGGICALAFVAGRLLRVSELAPTTAPTLEPDTDATAPVASANA